MSPLILFKINKASPPQLGTGKGYFGGGMTAAGEIAVIDRLEFQAQVAAPISAALSTPVAYNAGVASSVRGYFAGGGYYGKSNKIDGLDFQTEVSQLLSAVLVNARYGLAGVNSTSRGYLGAGYGSAGLTEEIDGLDFTTEAAINPSAALSLARRIVASTCLPSTAGYFGGGRSNGTAWYSMVDRLDFHTVTRSLLGTGLSPARAHSAGSSSLTHGYFIGGYTGVARAEIDKLAFSTNTVFALGSLLAVGLVSAGATSSNTHGYYAGGNNYLASIGSIDFSNDGLAALSAQLSQARYGLAGVRI